MSTYRRLHERPLIEEILGERYEPHMSDRSPVAPEEDPSTIEARKRADALGRSGHQVTFAPHAADAGFAGFGPPPLSAAAAESRDPPPAPATAEARDRAQGGGSRGNQGFPRDQWRRRESNARKISIAAPSPNRPRPLGPLAWMESLRAQRSWSGESASWRRCAARSLRPPAETAARAEGAAVCFGTCYEREGRPPYAPWDEALTQYTRALEPGSFPQGVRESAAIVAPVVPEFDWAVEAEPERLRLVISVHTVERHLATIYRKIGVRNRTEATAFAYKSGLANT